MSQDDADRPHPTSFYGPPHDTVINSRPDDADSQDIGAAGGFPSLLSNYQFYVGTPDLKPSHAHHISRYSPTSDHRQASRYADTPPELPH